MYKNKETVFSLLITILYVYILSCSLIASLPSNPLSFSLNKQQIVKQIIPQGWGFFSIDPRKSNLTAYPLEGDTLLWPNSTKENFYGFSRKGRSQGVEIGTLVSQISEKYYVDCEDDINKCIKNLHNEYKLENSNKSPSICGKWVFGQEQPVPWAWANSKSKINMPSKLIKVEVKCK